MKVEAWLRMAKLEYEVVDCPDPRKMPMGKLPVIVEDGEMFADSCLIRDHLSLRYGVDFDAHLNAAERAIAHAFETMIEERFYWVVVYVNWTADNWPALKKHTFGHLPPVVREMVPRMVQGKVKRDLDGHGLGLHQAQSVYRFARQDLESLSVHLADKPYFMGDKLANIDLTLCAFLSCLTVPELESPLSRLFAEFENLQAYQARMAELVFPDFFDLIE